MIVRGKCHALTMEFKLLCGGRGRRTTLINGRRKDRLAKLITCKTCKRIWERMVSGERANL